ncbi:MAG: ParB/RepB/Spo0J family partition protein [Acidimicrobiia bacterium]
MRKGGLGRGLGALIPAEMDEAGVEEFGAALVELPIGSVETNPFQPRRSFDEEGLVSLAASIRELGVLQPILVRITDDGRYQLVAGERRLRASKRAGLDTIPAIIRTTSDMASLEQALVENLHRTDLNALDEAAAYQQLIDDFGLTHESLAQRVGKSRSAVSNTLRLMQLPPSIQHLLRDGRLSSGHARALLGTPDRAFAEGLARRVVEEGLSVRAVEDAVRARGAEDEAAGEAAPAPAERDPAASIGQVRPPGLLELEELLSNHLDTRVKVDMGSKRGKVVIEFATLEDLERIYRKVTEPGTG